MTTTTVRPELPPMPHNIAALPVHRGYPVPWFVAQGDYMPNGPDFRIIRPGGVAEAHNRGTCWVCGRRLQRFKAFVVGPMCAVNRTSAEPPSHPDCAEWSARACPFLTRPHARRRDVPEEVGTVEAPGLALKRNPGVALVWATRRYYVRRVPGGVLFALGEPEKILWLREGRPATVAEVMESIDTGLPALQAAARADGPRAVGGLASFVAVARSLVRRTAA